MKITKQQVLDNLDEVKKYISEAENKAEEKVLGIAIKNRFTGEIVFQSTKTAYKEAIIEKGDTDLSEANLREADLSEANLSGADLGGANLREANLSGADLSGADLGGADLGGANLSGADLRGADPSGAELMNAKFYGKGGKTKIKKSQLNDFLTALGVIMED